MNIPNHGGDIYSYKSYYEGELLDFSSNINPLGFPEGLKEGIMSRFDEIGNYPDIKYRKLKENISKYLKTDSKYIKVGNGAVEIIDLIISQFKRMIIFDPGFSEYRLRGEEHGLEILAINLDRNMEIPMDEVEELLQEGDLILMANPNNPNGATLSEEKIVELYTLAVLKNAYLLLDEAFFEFANLDYDTVEIFKDLDYNNIGIIRAATKFFSVPGMRLGYGVLDVEMKRILEEKELPWTVNSFGVIASDYIFDENFISKSKDYIFKERKRYIDKLGSIKGVYPYNSNSNYVLLKLEDISEEKVFEEFLKRNILIRRCSNYKNLKGTHIRVAIKSKELNNRLVNALEEIMEEI